MKEKLLEKYLTQSRIFMNNHPWIPIIAIIIAIFMMFAYANTAANNSYLRKQNREIKTQAKEYKQKQEALAKAYLQLEEYSLQLAEKNDSLMGSYGNQVNNKNKILSDEAYRNSNSSGDELKRRLSETRHPLRSED